MTSEEASDLVVSIECMRLLVWANQLACDSDLARDAHDYVLGSTVHKTLTAHIDQISEAMEEPDPDRREDLLYHLRQCDQALERNWYEWQPDPVGGWNRAGEDGSFVNPVTGEAASVGDFPVTLPIPPERLCGLPPILDQIERECRIHFSLEIVFYRPHAKQDAGQRKIEPFDPAAEIPW